MDRMGSRLTVYFDEPFWVGVFERFADGKLTVAKVTFGAEPKDFEVYEFVLRHSYELRHSPAVDTGSDSIEVGVRKNPKRVQREVKKHMQSSGIGTKSQQALKLQHEENKLERKVRSRRQKLEEAERMFELKQQKRKDKHRGH